MEEFRTQFDAVKMGDEIYTIIEKDKYQDYLRQYELLKEKLKSYV